MFNSQNSTQLRGYLTGLILGDGHIDNGVSKRAFRIKSIYEDFIDKILNDLSFTNFKLHKNSFTGYTDKYGTNHKDYFELYIEANPYFRKLYSNFYDDYKNRIISDFALNSLTLQGIANWYMSDGYITHVGKESGIIKDRRIDICTDRYSKDDCIKFSEYLTSIGYGASIVKRDKFYRVRIKQRCAQRLFLDIKDFIVPSMYYKLNLMYDYKPDWMSEEYFDFQNSLISAETH